MCQKQPCSGHVSAAGSMDERGCAVSISRIDARLPGALTGIDAAAKVQQGVQAGHVALLHSANLHQEGTRIADSAHQTRAGTPQSKAKRHSSPRRQLKTCTAPSPPTAPTHRLPDTAARLLTAEPSAAPHQGGVSGQGRGTGVQGVPLAEQGFQPPPVALLFWAGAQPRQDPPLQRTMEKNLLQS